MKIEKYIDSSDPVSLISFADKLCIIFARKNKVTDFEIRDDINSINIPIYYLNSIYAAPQIDDSHLYLPSDDGRIMIINITTQTATICDLGSMSLAHEFVVKNDLIYSVCRVPVSNSIVKPEIQYCICVSDKNTGKKLYQSQSLVGQVSGLAVSSNAIYLVKNRELYQFSLKCEFQQKIETLFYGDPFVLDNHHVFVRADNGFLGIYDNNLNNLKSLIAERNITYPILVGTSLFWACDQAIYEITFDWQIRQRVKHHLDGIHQSKKNLDSLYVVGNSGDIAVFNTCNDEFVSKKICRVKLQNLTIVNSNIFVTCENKVFKWQH